MFAAVSVLILLFSFAGISMPASAAACLIQPNPRDADFVQKALLSPEEMSLEETTARGDNSANYDADRDGQLTMRDYACLRGQPESWRTVFVAPQEPGAGPGQGTSDDPFRLYDGNEYDFNILLRQTLDAGINVEVIFRSGVYLNVRLQIIKEGYRGLAPGNKSAGALMMLEDAPPSGLNQKSRQTAISRCATPTRPEQKCVCNREGRNCRVPSDYFAFGYTEQHYDNNPKLVLRAEELGKAVFWARDFANTHKNIGTEALLISGAALTGPTNPDISFSNLNSKKIQNILVSGLAFREYTNGIHVQYGTSIVVKNCTVLSVGTRDLTDLTGKTEKIGTYGLRADGDSQVVLFKNNKIIDAWNSVREPVVDNTKKIGVLGMIHSIYFGYVRDVIFLSNELNNASGALLKFGYYAPLLDGKASRELEYPHEYSWQRRVFFLGNHFIQDKVFDRDKHATVSSAIMSFVHENSQTLNIAGERTAGAQGVVMIGNRFRIDILAAEAGDPLDHMSFLREELPKKCMVPEFKDWFVGGNSITGRHWSLPQAKKDATDRHPLFYARARGSAIDPPPAYPDPACHGADRLTPSFQATLQEQAKPNAQPFGLNAAIEATLGILDNKLRSDDPARDQLMKDIVKARGIPGLDIPD